MSVTVFLITSSAVLLDLSLRISSSPRDRAVIGLLLWLAAALEDAAMDIWASAVFAAILISASGEMLVEDRELMGRIQARRSSWSLSTLRALLSTLPTATWTALVASMFSMTWWIAGLALASTSLVLVSCLHRRPSTLPRRSTMSVPWCCRRRSPPVAAEPLEESHWYEWTRDQVLQWLAVLDSDCPRRLPRLLARQSLTGQRLGRLSTNQLCQWGVDYGTACDLIDSIQRLQGRYPQPDDDAASNIPSWLAEHDLEYNRPFTEPVPAAPSSIASAPVAPPVVEPDLGMDLQAQRVAQQLMREQFGLELPSIWPDESGASATRPSMMSFVFSEPLPTFTEDRLMPQAQVPCPNNVVDGMQGLPPEFLANMPPTIADMVRSKPHLVRQALQARLKREQAAQQDPSRPQAVLEEDENEWREPNDTDEEDDRRGEKTELLRRRGGPAAKYKSIL